MFYFGEEQYHIDESDGYVDVKVWRTGTDLSKTGSVTVRSRKAEPVSAEGRLGTELFTNRTICELSVCSTSNHHSPQHIISRSASPPAGSDYVGISRNLDFAPGVSMLTFRVAILDDLGQPELEGTETFDLVLRMAVNGILGEPGKSTVFINDSVSDCESFSLKHQ